jgi:hypothetical protein
VGVTVRLGDWGVLDLLGPGDRVPERLLAVRALWEHDPRRVPALLTSRGATHPYVVCWPDDAPVPDLDGEPDLSGAAIGEPASLHCFACGADHDAIYPDGGMPGFSLRGHRIAAGCPTCGADSAASRMTALAIGEARPARRSSPGAGTRPALLAVSLVAYLFVALSLGFGLDDGTAGDALVFAAIGLAVLSPPVLAMRTNAFRWIVGAFAALTVLGFFGGGVVMLPSVLVMAFAAMAPPPPRGWRMGLGLKAFCVAGALLFAAGVTTLALAR